MTPETSPSPAEHHVIELRHEQGVIPDHLVSIFGRIARDIATQLGIENFREARFDVTPEDIVEVDGDPKRRRTKRVIITTDLSEEFRTAFTAAMTGESGYALSDSSSILKIHNPPDAVVPGTTDTIEREAV